MTKQQNGVKSENGITEGQKLKQHVPANDPDNTTPEPGDGAAATSEIANKTTLEFHEYANLFPMHSVEERGGLFADIQKNGLIEPVVMLAGKILDGRNRATICQELGTQPKTIEYDGDDPLGFVLSKNVHRRHLCESQRAMVAAKLANMKQGKRKNAKPANLPVSGEPANKEIEAQKGPVSQSKAAEILNVSERLVRDAAKLRKEATPEVIEKVEQGQQTIHAAISALAKKPASEGDKPKKKPKQGTGDETNGGTPSNWDASIIDMFAKTLALPINSPEQSEALLQAFSEVVEKKFTKQAARQEFLQNFQDKWGG